MCLSLVKATSHGCHCHVAKVLNCPLLKRETEEWHRNLSTNVKKKTENKPLQGNIVLFSNSFACSSIFLKLTFLRSTVAQCSALCP